MGSQPPGTSVRASFSECTDIDPRSNSSFTGAYGWEVVVGSVGGNVCAVCKGHKGHTSSEWGRMLTWYTRRHDTNSTQNT